MPPATRTVPSGSLVAVCSARGVLMLPVAAHVPAAGAVDGVACAVRGGVGEPPVSSAVAEGTDGVAASGVAEAQPASKIASAPNVVRTRIAIPPDRDPVVAFLGRGRPTG